MTVVSTITVNGQVVATPGAYSTFDTTEAQIPGLSSGKTLAIVSDFLGGQPQTLLEYNSLSAVREAFPFSAVADDDKNAPQMTRLALNASNDSLVSGNPGRILLVKANRDTAGTGVLQGPSGPLANLTAKDYGAHTNQFSWQVGLGSVSGISMEVSSIGNIVVESVDNLGGDVALSLEYTGQADDMTATLVPDGSPSLTLAFSDTNAGLQGVASEIQAGWNAGDVATVASTSGSDDYQTVTVYGIRLSAPVAETIAIGATGSQQFDDITGVQMSGTSIGTVTVDDALATTVATIAATIVAITTPPDVLTIESTSASDAGIGVQLVGVGSTGVELSETVILNGVTPVSTVNSYSRVRSAQIVGTTAGTVALKDAASVTLLSLVAGADQSIGLDNTKGLLLVTSIPVNDTLGYVQSNVNDFVVRGISSAGVQAAELFSLISGTGSTTFTGITQIELGAVPVADTVALSGASKTLEDVTIGVGVADLNLLAGVTAVSSNDARYIDHLDAAALVSIAAGVVDFYSRAQDTVDWFNNVSTLIEAERIAGASGAPVVTVGAQQLTGGTSATSTTADVQAAFDLLKADPAVHWIVPGYTTETAHLLVAQHCRDMNTALYNRERQACCALPSTLTKEQIRTRRASINSEWVVAVCAHHSYYGDDGVLRESDDLAAALQFAGMSVKATIGEPMTRKFVNALAVATTNYDPNNPEDREEMIKAGLCFAESIPGVGRRWVRSITTYGQRVDRIRTESSSMESAAWSLSDLRDFMNGKLTGRKNITLTADGVRNVAEGRLDWQVEQGVIAAWRNATAELRGGSWVIPYELAPVEPNNFILLKAHAFTLTLGG